MEIFFFVVEYCLKAINNATKKYTDINVEMKPKIMAAAIMDMLLVGSVNKSGRKSASANRRARMPPVTG